MTTFVELRATLPHEDAIRVENLLTFIKQTVPLNEPERLAIQHLLNELDTVLTEIEIAHGSPDPSI